MLLLLKKEQHMKILSQLFSSIQEPVDSRSGPSMAEKIVAKALFLCGVIQASVAAYQVRLVQDSQPRICGGPFIGLEGDLSHLSEFAALGLSVAGGLAILEDLEKDEFRHTATYLTGAVAYMAGLSLPTVAIATLATHTLANHADLREAVRLSASRLYHSLQHVRHSFVAQRPHSA
jgi:hypothetical protein